MVALACPALCRASEKLPSAGQDIAAHPRFARERIALAELEAGASAALTVLLALFLARVARQVAGLLERPAERRVGLDQAA
jgi:hypothetical protein